MEISSGYDHPLNPGLLAFTISGTPTAIENAKLQIFYAVVRAGVIMPQAIAHAHRVACRVVSCVAHGSSSRAASRGTSARTTS